MIQQARLLDEIKQLTVVDRLAIVEATLQLIRQDLQPVEQPAQARKKQRLAAAAKALLPDYASGGELTAFTTLDSEDFYAQE